MPVENEDKSLVVKAIAQPAAFGAIVVKYENPLRSFIYRISGYTPPESDDVLQDIFVKVWINLQGYDHSFAFSTWLYRIARNATYDDLRKKKRNNQNTTHDETALGLLTDNHSLLDEIEQKANAVEVKKALGNLKSEYKDALILHYFEGKTLMEIAHILEKPKGTISTYLNRGRTALKQKLSHLNPIA